MLITNHRTMAIMAFYRAILKGSQQHHWDFGDMPAVTGLKDADEIKQVVAYVRWMQQQAGIQ